MLPSNLKNINFNWLYLSRNNKRKHHIEMVNNIPNYYHVEILFAIILDLNGQFMFLSLEKNIGHQRYMKSKINIDTQYMVLLQY